MNDAPKTISVDFNGNGTASVISDVPAILGTVYYTLTASVEARLDAADELANRLDAKLRICCGGTDEDRAALAAYRATAEGDGK